MIAYWVGPWLGDITYPVGFAVAALLRASLSRKPAADRAPRPVRAGSAE